MHDNMARESVSRRVVIRGAAVLGSAPLVIGSMEPAFAKVSQTSVAYQGSPKDGHDCSNCGLFDAPASCKSVSGAVSPSGWCKIWVNKAG